MNEKTAPRRVAVLGALSAIAEETCRLLAAEGAHIALLGREEARLNLVAQDLRLRGAASVICDARDLAAETDHAGVLARIAAALGGLDAILLFYGILGDQARAESDPGEARRIVEVNFTSAALWLLAGAKALEASASGAPAIVAASSVAGDRGRRANFVYGAAKAGLSVLVQGLAHKYAPAGKVRAVVLKIGPVDTPMTAGMKPTRLWSKPEAVARAVRRAIDRGGPIVYAPAGWRWIMLILRLAPQSLFNRIDI